MSELGKLPGWVKVGALGVSVGGGMGGVHVPGGGVSKIWAGNWHITVSKDGANGKKIEVRDAEKNVLDEVRYAIVKDEINGSYRMEVIQSSFMTVINSFVTDNTGRVFFDVGTFHFASGKGDRLEISGGSKDDSLYVCNTDVLVRDGLKASIFCVERCNFFENLSEISADVVVLGRCTKFRNYILSSDVLCLFEACVENRGKITTRILNYKDTGKIVNVGDGILSLRKNTKFSLLSRLDWSSSSGTIQRGITGIPNAGWLTYDEKGSVPFFNAKGDVFMEEDGNVPFVHFRNTEDWYFFAFLPITNGKDLCVASYPLLQVRNGKDSLLYETIGYTPKLTSYVNTIFVGKISLKEKDDLKCRFAFTRACGSYGGSVVVGVDVGESIVYLLPKEKTVE